MKNTLVALALASSSAFAFPSVGNEIQGKITWRSPAGRVMETAERTERIVGVAPAPAAFLVKTIDVYAHQPTRTETKPANPPSEADLDYVLSTAYCVDANHGVLEQVQVPAGLFDTCRLNQTDGSVYWIGKVPFGFVKATVPGSSATATFELSKVVDAQ